MRRLGLTILLVTLIPGTAEDIVAATQGRSRKDQPATLTILSAT